MENITPVVRVIVQARTDSRRLPAKALLPIGGLPSAVLAVKRAENLGHSAILATSDRHTDDLLATTARRMGINVFRGSANNVLARFVAASEDLQDEDILVRLTGDNVLPDGIFLDELLATFMTSGQPYLGSEEVWGPCPYGLSAEAMRVGALRRVARQPNCAFDREHVTPVLRKAVSVRPQELRFSLRERAIRCTVDILDDYLRISRIFSEVRSPTQVSWAELLEHLVTASDAPPPIAPGPRLVLGTAQLAAPYGSAVRVKPPEVGQAVQLVRQAIHQGATAIDTARVYAGSEAVLARALSEGWNSRVQVVTKLSPLGHLPVDAAPDAAADAAEISVYKSLHELERIKPWLLLHRIAHLEAWNGAVWARLQELYSRGLLAGLGVSVQSPTELASALAIPDVKLIQMPFNLLDWRWRNAGIEEMFASRPDIEVHVRSVFLQGLLLRNSDMWPLIPGLDGVALHRILHWVAENTGRVNVADLCLAYARSMPWIDGVVIGMERESQLAENVALFGKQPLSVEEVDMVHSSLPLVPEAFLNPAQWPESFQSHKHLAR